MPHPAIDNDTPLLVEPLCMLDEHGRTALTVVVKAGFAIESYGLALLSEQPGLVHGGEFWHPNAPISSYRLEPEVTPFKPSTDVVILAQAHASTPVPVIDVGVRVGTLHKFARVFGDRHWRAVGHGEPRLTAPQPFMVMPLVYERAFGGRHDHGRDDGVVDHDPRNPVGRGHRPQWRRPVDGELAPNIEDPSAPITRHEDRPAPVGLGFVSPDWQPRLRFAGTYDRSWAASRRPLLPTDFDPRFHNAASHGLVAPGYLRGDEDVETFNLTPEGHAGFRLPGVRPPTLRLSSFAGPDRHPALVLDTIIIDLIDRRLTLLWRTRVELPGGLHQLHAIELRSSTARSFPRTHVDAWTGNAANGECPRHAGLS